MYGAFCVLGSAVGKSCMLLELWMCVCVGMYFECAVGVIVDLEWA